MWLWNDGFVFHWQNMTLPPGPTRDKWLQRESVQSQQVMTALLGSFIQIFAAVYTDTRWSKMRQTHKRSPERVTFRTGTRTSISSCLPLFTTIPLLMDLHCPLILKSNFLMFIQPSTFWDRRDLCKNKPWKYRHAIKRLLLFPYLYSEYILKCTLEFRGRQLIWFHLLWENPAVNVFTTLKIH